MGDTSPVFPYARVVAVFACGFALCGSAHGKVSRWQSAVNAASRTSQDARVLVVDIETNRVLASQQLGEAARTVAAPGSTLKPLVLFQLLAQNRWNPGTRVACTGDLMIGGHRMACSHPAAPAFDARQALAWSCNTYFAQVARSLQPSELDGLLHSTGLLGPTGLVPGEALADFYPPQSPVQIELALLGVDGIRITPLELAEAYRWLGRELTSNPSSVATRTVLAGLADSATFGMAGQAGLGGVSIAGKTGTAEGTDTARTHGWFAGLAPANQPRVVVVVFVPSGRGADAAHLASMILAGSPLRHR
ncbi:MAG: penicillin-binding transpeptidase domain-containing protein [Acidobacteriota bacterium]